MTTFEDRLTISLALAAGSSTFSVPGASVERFSLRLRSWGFEAEATFVVVMVVDPAEDTLFDPFMGLDLMTATLSIGRTYDEPDEVATPVVLTGVVTDKSVVEEPAEGVAGAPVLLRRYGVRFADRCAVLWSEHRPTRLYVDSTLEALFTDNLPDGVTLTHSWTASSTTHPVLSLGLGVDENRASFADFVFWLLDREAAGLFYDVAGDAYEIADAKPTDGADLTLEREEVAEIEVRFPPLRRAKVVVLNGSTEAAEAKKEGTNEQAAVGVRADYLVRTPLASAHDARSTLEASRAQQPLARVRTALSEFPTTPVVPNANFSFGDDFSANLFVSGKSFRVVSVDITGKGLGDDGGLDEGASNRFELTYDIGLEQASDPVFHAPPFVEPVWPFHVEGKVVSETGAEDEETYQVYQDADTSLDQYKIAVPLFDDKQVVASFEPTTLSGHFYFPAYKGERVLVALDFDEARLAGFLDWRAGARLPLESQGNHILFGKKATSQTSVRHAYEDAKPFLQIHRVSDKDEQTLKILEGTITMETKEND